MYVNRMDKKTNAHLSNINIFNIDSQVGGLIERINYIYQISHNHERNVIEFCDFKKKNHTSVFLVINMSDVRFKRFI